MTASPLGHDPSYCPRRFSHIARLRHASTTGVTVGNRIRGWRIFGCLPISRFPSAWFRRDDPFI